LQFDFIGLSVDSQYVVYAISKFILGSASNGFFTVGYTLIMELTPARKSTLVSNFVLCMFVVGELVIGLVALLSKSWIIINWFIAGFALILLILFVLFLPESPKYLIDRRKNKELEIMMMQIARFNRKVFTISSDVKENNGEMKINGDDNEAKSIEKNDESSEEKTILTLIFKTKGELKKIIFISFIWFSLSMTYYGVSLGKCRFLFK
jgi:MFS family permease